MRRDYHPDVKMYHAKAAAADAADAAYSAAIKSAGYKDRWTLPIEARTIPQIAAAYTAKVQADAEAMEWFRRSFAACHTDPLWSGDCAYAVRSGDQFEIIVFSSNVVEHVVAGTTSEAYRAEIVCRRLNAYPRQTRAAHGLL